MPPKAAQAQGRQVPRSLYVRQVNKNRTQRTLIIALRRRMQMYAKTLKKVREKMERQQRQIANALYQPWALPPLPAPPAVQRRPAAADVPAVAGS